MKGMNKIKRGRGFRGLLEYLFTNKDGPAPGRLIGGTMASSNARDLAVEFKASRQLRPDIEKPVWHNSLRMPAGEDVADAKWEQIARDYLQEMGFDLDKTQYCLVKHDDEGAVHVCASRVALNGSVYLGKNENLKSTRVIQELEKRHGLTVTKGPELNPDGRTALPRERASKTNKNELEAALRTKTVPPRERLKTMVAEALADHPSLPEFKRRLEQAGVVVKANMASTGRLNGFSFKLDGVAFKGSQLGDQYKWKSIKEKLNYDESRDAYQLEAIRTQPLTSSTELARANLRAAGRNIQAAKGAAGSLDRAQRFQADRRNRRIVTAAVKAALRQVEHDRPATVDCAEADLSRRQAYKRQLFEERYNARVSAALLSRLQYVKREVCSTTLKLQGGGLVVDRGDTMTTRSQATQEEVKALLELAQIKGWKAINIKPEGSNDFKAMVSEEAFKAGIRVEGYQLSAERQQDLQIELERERVQRARTEFSAPTPRPR